MANLNSTLDVPAVEPVFDAVLAAGLAQDDDTDAYRAAYFYGVVSLADYAAAAFGDAGKPAEGEWLAFQDCVPVRGGCLHRAVVIDNRNDWRLRVVGSLPASLECVCLEWLDMPAGWYVGPPKACRMASVADDKAREDADAFQTAQEAASMAEAAQDGLLSVGCADVA